MKSVFENFESNVRSYCRRFDTVFTKAKDACIYDEDGLEFIDFFSGAGALNFGHNNDIIKEKIIDYIMDDNIIHGLDMYTKAKHDFIIKFNDEILKPRNLSYKQMFCGPTGTNAVEASLKLARKIKKRSNVFAFSGAFHGMSIGSLALTTDKTSREGAGIPLNNVTFVPYESGCNAEFDTIAFIENLLTDDHSGVDKPAAIMLETVQAEGGVYIASVPWLKRLYQLCQKHDILLICDDIQVGCGRTGTFFSFERAGIIPDMIILSKSISGYGFPMSLLLIKEELDIWKPGEHNGTFRGNQLAFVGAAAAIDLWKTDFFQQTLRNNSKIIESFLINEIMPIIKGIKVRGYGLIWAIDFSEIPGLSAQSIAKNCFSKGLIIENCGRNDSSLKLLPPLAISEKTLNMGLNIIKDSIISFAKI